MKRTYKFFLRNHKVMMVTTFDNVTAKAIINDKYPDYQISMFWMVWPY
jgi:hypothetical protein